MSRLGGAGAVAPLVTDIPLASIEVMICRLFVMIAAFLYLIMPW